MLTFFAKVNLAHCATQRAEAALHYSQQRPSYQEREEIFLREFDSVRLWMNHRMSYHQCADGKLLHVTQR